MMSAFNLSSIIGNGKNQGIVRSLLLVALSFWIFIVAGRLLIVELQAAPSFDGAMNLEVAHSLAHGEGYRRMYTPRNLFPHEIQTNAPYILPAALVLRLFGVGIAQSEIVNIAYFLALAVLSYLLVRAAGAGKASMLGVVAVLATPGILRFGFAGHGEIPGLVWLLAATAVYFWPRATGKPGLSAAFFAGVLLALAYLTKTVMLIGIAVFGFVALFDLFFGRRQSIHGKLPEIASLAGGWALPMVGFESWKLAALGGLRPWLDWWRTELGNVLWQAGVSKEAEAGASGLIRKILHHFDILSGFYELPRWIVCGWLILVFGCALTALAKARRDRRYLVVTVVLGTAAVYFAWWLALTPDSRAWLRRIMNGMLLANLGMLIFAWVSATKPTGSLLVSCSKTLLLLIFPAIVFFQQSVTILSQPNPNNSDLLTTSRNVHDLPQDAYIFGVGWDAAAPDIALFSGRIITNFNQIAVSRLEPDRPAYAVMQPSPDASEKINHAFSMYGVTVPQMQGYGIYEIPSFMPARMKFDIGKVRSIIDNNVDYPYVQGAYKAVPTFGRWLASDNLLALRGVPPQTFKLTGYAPPRDQYLYPEPMHATVSFDGCRTAPQTVPNDKLFTLYFDVPTDCSHPRDGVWSVRIEMDNVINLSDPQGDHRSLSIVAKELGFVDADRGVQRAD
ncbi:MAG: ArnT family glycosyltransferase [Dyella sp.]|uniref:ArnT family glycosyltransferase n=1 Tax=Dyella sp. TaxID=1869338 RepID=UPI003F823BB6